ncbi:MAG: MFS transporter [Xanthobacteraceae bacterium]|nr:MFS transporter [Xanthobacteraceae bacterium]
MPALQIAEPMSRRQTLFVLLCASVPSFMINLDSNIVAVSLSSIARSLKADFADIEWVISAYTLTFASLMLPSGELADRFGRRRILLVGLVVFTAASFLCGAAPNIMILNGARALQGVGAALQLSAALAILSHSFHGAARARAFAFWGSVIGVAMSLGPVAGGFITQHFGWEWAFYVNVPVGIGLVLLTALTLAETRDPDAGRIDIAGFATFSSALFLVTLALISGNRDGWSRPVIVGEFAGATVLFVAFLVAESVQRRPMLDLRFFRNPTYIGANITGVTYAAALLTMLTYLPMYFQSALGFDAQTAGLLMLPMAFPLFLVPRIVVRSLVHRFSGRVLLTTGLVLVSCGLIWLGLQASRFNYLSLLGGMLIAGTGAGVLNGEIAKVSMTVIPPERAGMAAGVGGTLRFSGIVIGFAALGAILFARVSSVVASSLPDAASDSRADFTRNIAAGHLSDVPAGLSLPGQLQDLALRSFGAGYQALFFSAATLALVAAVLSWFFIRSSDTSPLKLMQTEPQPEPAE